MTHKNTSTK